MKIFGHRGVRKNNDKNAPYQNTLEAIELAFAENADGVEIDVILSKDNKLFIIHDNELSKHTNHSGLLSKLNADEVANIKAGKKYTVPQLETLLDLLTNKYPDKHLNIELKGQNTAIPTVELIKQKNFNKANLTLSSFDHQQLHDVYNANPEIKLGLLLEKKMLKKKSVEQLTDPFKNYPSFYSINAEDKILPDILKTKIGGQKKLYIWSMSDKPPTEKYVKNLKENKVDCLITDYPAIAIAHLNSL